jgi:hypothetical protein
LPKVVTVDDQEVVNPDVASGGVVDDFDLHRVAGVGAGIDNEFDHVVDAIGRRGWQNFVTRVD